MNNFIALVCTFGVVIFTVGLIWFILVTREEFVLRWRELFGAGDKKGKKGANK